MQIRTTAKKTVLILIAVLMVMTITVGCGNGTPTERTSANPEDTEAQTASQGDETEPAQLEEMEISLALPDIAENFSTDNPDIMQKYVEDKFNVKFVPYSIGWGDLTEKLGVAAASGDLPDVFMHALRGTQTYVDWVDQGIVKVWDLDPVKYPLTYELTQLPHVKGYWENDEIYFLPRVSYSDFDWWCLDKAVYLRKDWMEALDAQSPTNNEEFIQLMMDFTTKDPDGNGINDTYGVTPSSVDYLASLIYFQYAPEVSINGWGTYVKDQDTGEFTVLMTQPRAKKALSFLRELWVSGLMDPDFPTYKSEDDATAAFVSGRVGALAFTAPPDHIRSIYDSWIKVNTDKNYFDCVEVMMPWPGEDGKMYRNTQIEWSETYCSASIPEDKAQRYLQIHEWLVSEEGILFANLGLEGTSYEVTDDGYKSLLGVRDTGDPVVPLDEYPSLRCFNVMALWAGADAQFFNPANPKPMVEASENYRDYMLENGEFLDFEWDALTIVSKDMSMLGIDYDAEVLQFIMAPPEVSNDEAWDDLQERLSSYGLDRALESYNELAREKGLIQ